MLLTLRHWVDAILHPQLDPEVQVLLEEQRNVPTLWLLGKTGAGKTSTVQALTGDSSVEIGNGFEPCTATARLYSHPADFPVVRFLDTRGLGEPGYDPQEDLDQCINQSHLMLLVVRSDDPVQDELLLALNRLGRQLSKLPILLLYTQKVQYTQEDQYSQKVDSLDRRQLADQERSMMLSKSQIEDAVGRTLDSVLVSVDDAVSESAAGGLGDAEQHGWSAVRRKLLNLVPELSELLKRPPKDATAEAELFARQRTTVLGYASACGAVDALPAVGLVAVPSLQGKLLHALAAAYGLEWNRPFVRRFLTVLGSGFLYRYGLSLGLRQLGKLVPVYGQTAGAAAAASISFASTYALGRAACLYCYRVKYREAIDTKELRDAFRQAFDKRQSP